MEQSHLDDEQLKQSYQKILNRSGCTNPVDSHSSGSDSDSERKVDPFQVELYVCCVRDRITQLLKDIELNPIYLKSNTHFKTRIKSISLEMSSNCCLLVSINYDNIKIKSKKAIIDSDMVIYTIHPETHKSLKFMHITNTVDSYLDTHELVIYVDNQNRKRVSFTIISDLDVTEGSLWFKVGYLDYSFH